MNTPKVEVSINKMLSKTNPQKRDLVFNYSKIYQLNFGEDNFSM